MSNHDDNLRQLLEEARQDIFEEIENRYPLHSRDIPSNMRRHYRDMDLVRRIDAVLEKNHE